VFFFGLLFIIEVALILLYGVDYRMIETAYIGRSFSLGVIGLAYRLVIPCVVGVCLVVALNTFLSRTFYGRAIMGVSQDSLALRLMGVDPIKLPPLWFATPPAGALSRHRPCGALHWPGVLATHYCVRGVGSISGTLVAAFILGGRKSYGHLTVPPGPGGVVWCASVRLAIRPFLFENSKYSPPDRSAALRAPRLRPDHGRA
jgi:branched-chain amino acid transport system permease protein